MIRAPFRFLHACGAAVLLMAELDSLRVAELPRSVRFRIHTHRSFTC